MKKPKLPNIKEDINLVDDNLKFEKIKNKYKNFKPIIYKTESIKSFDELFKIWAKIVGLPKPWYINSYSFRDMLGETHEFYSNRRLIVFIDSVDILSKKLDQEDFNLFFRLLFNGMMTKKFWGLRVVLVIAIKDLKLKKQLSKILKSTVNDFKEFYLNTFIENKKIRDTIRKKNDYSKFEAIENNIFFIKDETKYRQLRNKYKDFNLIKISGKNISSPKDICRIFARAFNQSKNFPLNYSYLHSMLFKLENTGIKKLFLYFDNLDYLYTKLPFYDFIDLFDILFESMIFRKVYGKRTIIVSKRTSHGLQRKLERLLFEVKVRCKGVLVESCIHQIKTRKEVEKHLKKLENKK